MGASRLGQAEEAWRRVARASCLVAFVVAFAIGCNGEAERAARPASTTAASPSERVEPRHVGDALVFGPDPRNTGEILTAAAILEDAQNYEGKTVAVAGRITEVCEMTGCWFELQSGGKGLTVPIAGERFSIQPTVVGRDAVIEGVVRLHAEEAARIEATSLAVLGVAPAPAKAKAGADG